MGEALRIGEDQDTISGRLGRRMIGGAAFRAMAKLIRSREGRHHARRLPGILANIARNWRRGLSEEDVAAPLLAAISVTERCNLKCVGCFARDIIGPREIEESVLRQRIEEFLAKGTRLFVIIGGEPFAYRPGIVRVLADYPKAVFFVYTNATLIDDTQIQALQNAPNVQAMLSIEGAEQLTDSRRGRGVYAKVMDTHRRLCAGGVMHGLSFTVTRANIETVSDPAFLASFDRRHLAFVHYLQLMGAGCADTRALAATDSQKRAHDRRIAALRRTADFAITNVPDDEIAVWGRCGAGGRGLLHILPDGQVQSCIFGHTNVLDGTGKTLDNVLFDPRMVEVRQSAGCSAECGCEARACPAA